MPEATPEMPTRHADGEPVEEELPRQLGRYRVTGRLGRGGFGVVYKGYDDELRREVAIKVPHRRRVSSVEEADAFLAEARNLASLNHPGIVPVFDVGRADDGSCYVVSQFIAGSNLAGRMRQGRWGHAESAALVAGVAEALHHAHQRGLVHRDVKPANILLDDRGRPIVVDFGLALSERHIGLGPSFAGTPAYMSPEQARGEGHRVDARSDVYSLGVIFHELLTGHRPYPGDSLRDILEQIQSLDVRPCRQFDDTIPKELDRICQKALAKRAADRYSTAIDLADDLRHWLSSPRTPASAALAAPLADSDKRTVPIVPKGLRSFDAADADFFLELLPGPRDRAGLPESIRFWKHAIRDAAPFSVGLLYGPSGCGKSSLVKAGLLPRLDERVVSVYLEATPDDTEPRLLKALRRRCPGIPEGLSLVETLAYLRQNPTRSGGKLLLVLDQFEQWLHARRDEQAPELVQALRHCDGDNVQCLVMVRDDFWMAATRFMRALEIQLMEGKNSAAVDLFDARHARKVLTAFGRAFGCLPAPPAALSAEQVRFLEQAVAGLAQDGKVVSVRISLFTEMVKGKPWTPATLQAVGGMEGIGETFLEETFSAATAPPEHRWHQKAARAVLKALLPRHGTDIKGHMRSSQELLEASGYVRRPREFSALLSILDTELRLVTPSDPENHDALVPATTHLFYQLTHDYLVPALRQWLSRKQRETIRGRAEWLLAERSAAWNAQPQWRQLPTPWEGLKILLFTQRQNWTPSERRMLSLGNRLKIFQPLFSSVVLASLMTLAVWGLVEWAVSLRVSILLQHLASANTTEVPKIVDDLTHLSHWSQPRLQQLLHDAPLPSKARLHASLALLPRDPGQIDFLLERLLNASPDELPIIRAALDRHRAALVDRLWPVTEEADANRRFRAACALAAYDPDNPRWTQVRDAVADTLVLQDPLTLGAWVEVLWPVRAHLLLHLADIANNSSRGEPVRIFAQSILAKYSPRKPATP